MVNIWPGVISFVDKSFAFLMDWIDTPYCKETVFIVSPLETVWFICFLVRLDELVAGEPLEANALPELRFLLLVCIDLPDFTPNLLTVGATPLLRIGDTEFADAFSNSVDFERFAAFILSKML